MFGLTNSLHQVGGVPFPYSVISHSLRDNRCHIRSPMQPETIDLFNPLTLTITLRRGSAYDVPDHGWNEWLENSQSQSTKPSRLKGSSGN